VGGGGAGDGGGGGGGGGGVVDIFLVASCYRDWGKLQPDQPLGLYADFTFTLVYTCTSTIN